MNPFDDASWAVSVSCLDPRRQAVIKEAADWLGTKETGGPNRGTQIDLWNQRCGAPLGSPWCASFASWCISVPGLQEVKIASAIELGQSLRVPSFVTPGDVMWFRTGPGTGHCGIIIGVGPGEVATIEGNHGDQVAMVRRSLGEIQFCTNLSSERPGIPPGLPMVPAKYAGTR